MICYFDTSLLVKLLVEDEPFRAEADRLWLESSYVVCAEIGYVEARAALASARRGKRLTARAFRTAKDELETLWLQVSVVPVDDRLVREAGDLAENAALRGYDGVHLAAALRAQAEVMATADLDLARAARSQSLAVASPQ